MLFAGGVKTHRDGEARLRRSEEHTSELQSLAYLVCRLLLLKNTASDHRLQPNSCRKTGCGIPGKVAGKRWRVSTRFCRGCQVWQSLHSFIFLRNRTHPGGYHSTPGSIVLWL